MLVHRRLSLTCQTICQITVSKSIFPLFSEDSTLNISILKLKGCLFYVCHCKITALKVFGEVHSTLNKRSFRECIDAIVKSFPDEDVFESLIHFLTTSVEVSVDTKQCKRRFLCRFY